MERASSETAKGPDAATASIFLGLVLVFSTAAFIRSGRPAKFDEYDFDRSNRVGEPIRCESALDTDWVERRAAVGMHFASS
jgi:hypothetical protein